jgi:rSAM/selenodomain-associated transferase 2
LYLLYSAGRKRIYKWGYKLNEGVTGISIIVPVLGEAGRINAFLDKLLRIINGRRAEIIVVDGANDAATISAIAHPDVIRIASERGRARQMNAGAAIAKGNILLFLHADVELGACAMEHVSAAMSNGEYAAGAFSLDFDNKGLMLRLIAARSNLRCRLSRIPYGDQGIFIKTAYFKQIGGYREIDFLEDVDLMRRIRRDGKKICLLKDKIITSARRWEKEGVLFCTLRNQVMVSLFALGVNPNRLAQFYRKIS